VLVYANFERMNRLVALPRMRSNMQGWRVHLSDPRLRAAFAIGFLILFAFIGIFTYVNFVLVQQPLSVGQMSLGLVYLVFLPSMFTTPMTGRLVGRYGARTVGIASLLLAIVGLPQLLVPVLPVVLIGMVLVGVGTFAAQAAVTGYVGRTATIDRGAASGLYLASYYAGGLTGAASLGQVYQWGGWQWTVLMVAVALGLAAMMARHLK
jgi:predicted MFS family arabinose efflux permease